MPVPLSTTFDCTEAVTPELATALATVAVLVTFVVSGAMAVVPVRPVTL